MKYRDCTCVRCHIPPVDPPEVHRLNLKHGNCCLKQISSPGSYPPLNFSRQAIEPRREMRSQITTRQTYHVGLTKRQICIYYCYIFLLYLKLWPLKSNPNILWPELDRAMCCQISVLFICDRPVICQLRNKTFNMNQSPFFGKHVISCATNLKCILAGTVTGGGRIWKN